MAEKADQEFHHEMVKFIRGKDHDIKPGSVWMIKAEIAKPADRKLSRSLADAERPDLLKEMTSEPARVRCSPCDCRAAPDNRDVSSLRGSFLSRRTEKSATRKLKGCPD